MGDIAERREEESAGEDSAIDWVWRKKGMSKLGRRPWGRESKMLCCTLD